MLIAAGGPQSNEFQGANASFIDRNVGIRRDRMLTVTGCALGGSATLEVRAGPGPKGPQVTEIISVDISTAAQEQPRRPRPERLAYQPPPDRPPSDRTTVEETGSVK
jgi:hypothetical protein